MATHSFCHCSRVPGGAEGCVATEQAISKLGITGRDLKIGGESCGEEVALSLPRGGDACSRVRDTGSDEIMPC